MVDGREVTETVNHGALYMYRGKVEFTRRFLLKSVRIPTYMGIGI